MQEKITTKSPQKEQTKNKSSEINLKQDYQQAKAILERQKNHDRIARTAVIIFFIFTLIAFFASME